MTKNNVVAMKDRTIQVLSAFISRINLFNRLGSQYEGDRDIYKALGYKTGLTYDDYQAQYDRQDIAKAIINRPVHATWHGQVKIAEPDTDKDTVSQFQKDWKNLYLNLRLKEKFIRLDKLASLGTYAVLLLGFDDTSSSAGLRSPVRGSRRKLLYVKPLSEASAKIDIYDENQNSPRYGLPLIYKVSGETSSGNALSLDVHYTRIIHVAGELLEDEVEGVPSLQPVYNRLFDLEKLVGASAEMFWRGARPGYAGKVDKDFTMTEEGRTALREQFEEYDNNLLRFLVNEGVDIKPLDMQVASPSEHVNVQLQMISAVTGIPLRILVGSERGELASSEDRTAWLELIQNRRDDYAEVQILRPFIDTCAKYGVIDTPKENYKIIWSDIFAPSKKEHAEIGKTRASALQSYMNNPAAEIVVPPEVFYKYMLGLDDEEIKEALALREEAMQGEVDEEIEQMRKLLGDNLPSAGGRQPSPGANPTVQEEMVE